MSRRSIAMLLCATLTACGGGATRAGLPNVPAVQHAAAATRGALVVRIPNRAAPASAERRARYISASTKSASVKIAPAAGCTQCSAPLTLEAGLTPASPGCSTTANGTTCTIALGLQAGSYTGTMSTYDGPLDAQGTPTGARLSAGDAFPIAIAQGSQNLIGVTLFAIPASLKLTPQSANFYAGGLVSGGAVIPALRLLGANAIGKALITAYDADGNAIAGPGAPTGFAMESNAFTASVSGNVATITATATVDSDVHELLLTATGAGCAEPEAHCKAFPIIGFEDLLAIADPGGGAGAVYLVPADAKTIAPVATITTGINKPNSVLYAPDGRLFVANTAGGNVAIYTPPYTGAPAVVSAGITDPRLIALAPDGTLLVANRTGASVTVLPPPYTASSTLSVSDGRGFAFDGAANVWIADYAKNAIVTAKPPYTALDPFKTVSGPNTTLNGPSGIAFNAAGGLWVANTLGNTLLRFQTFGSNAQPTATIKAGNDLNTLTAPSAVAVLRTGKTLLAIGPNFGASFDEATQVTLVESSLLAAPTSKIALDLAETAWFVNGNGQYFGIAYPYSSPNGYFNVFGAPLSATADIAVYP